LKDYVGTELTICCVSLVGYVVKMVNNQQNNICRLFLLLVWWLDIVVVPAGTGGGKLEGLDGEWEVLIIGVVDEEAVVDGLLQTLGLVALWHQGAWGSLSGALFDASRLGQGFIVSLDLVHNDPPFAVDVDGSLGLDVGGLRGAQVGLIIQLLQPVNRVDSVCHNILVQLLDRVVVVLDGLLDLVLGVLLIFDTPVLPVLALGAEWGQVQVLGVRVWEGAHRVVRARCRAWVNGGNGSNWSNGGGARGWSRSHWWDRFCGVVNIRGWLRVVGAGCVSWHWDWLRMAVWCRGGGVAVRWWGWSDCLSTSVHGIGYH